MKKNSFQIGVMAVDLLVDMLHRNERGIPIRPYLMMVEGSWVEGNTLRKPLGITPRPPLPQVNSLTEISVPVTQTAQYIL
jgi:LacI family transcriptional regulator